MCNVVMEFSPVKKMAMDLGVIQKLVIGTRAPEVSGVLEGKARKRYAS